MGKKNQKRARDTLPSSELDESLNVKDFWNINFANPKKWKPVEAGENATRSLQLQGLIDLEVFDSAEVDEIFLKHRKNLKDSESAENLLLTEKTKKKERPLRTPVETRKGKKIPNPAKTKSQHEREPAASCSQTVDEKCSQISGDSLKKNDSFSKNSRLSTEFLEGEAETRSKDSKISHPVSDDEQVKKEVNLQHQKCVSIEQTEAFQEKSSLYLEKLKLWNSIAVEASIHGSILAALVDAGFQQPTAIQEGSIIPAIRERKDIFGISETGTGKTLAYGIPIVQSIVLHLLNKSNVFSNKKYLEVVSSSTCSQAVPINALIILPSRELAFQVLHHLQAITKYTPILSIAIIGGMSLQKQERLLKRSPQIVIGTPGRLWSLIEPTRQMSYQGDSEGIKIDLKGLRHLVLDEADRLLEDGSFRDLSKILKFVHEELRKRDQLQTFIFSATLGFNPKTMQSDKGRVPNYQTSNRNLESLIERRELDIRRNKLLVVNLSVNPHKEIPASSSDSVSSNRGNNGMSSVLLPEGLIIGVLQCSSDDMEMRLGALLMMLTTTAPHASLSKTKKTVVFVNSISYVYRLESLLCFLLCEDKHEKQLPKQFQHGNFGFKRAHEVDVVCGLHSGLSQKQRLKKFDRFTNAKTAVLVSTDVASRGLDFTGVDVVVHFQIPRDASIFVHRSGRTARAKKNVFVKFPFHLREVMVHCAPGRILDFSEAIGVIGFCVCFSDPSNSVHWEKIFSQLDLGSLSDAKWRLPILSPLSAPKAAAMRKRFRLIEKLESEEHLINKSHKHDSQLKAMASKADLDLSDASEDEDSADLNKRKSISLGKMKLELRELLKQSIWN